MGLNEMLLVLLALATTEGLSCTDDSDGKYRNYVGVVSRTKDMQFKSHPSNHPSTPNRPAHHAHSSPAAPHAPANGPASTPACCPETVLSSHIYLLAEYQGPAQPRPRCRRSRLRIPSIPSASAPPIAFIPSVG